MTPRRLTSWRSDGLRLDVRDSGPLDGDAVVCLHGFPQDGSAYDRVAARLADDGMRVLTPDQRGYSPGARPAGAASYALQRTAGDVVALLDAAGVGRAHVVGHDWGGAVAWALASRHAGRVRSLAALSTPHPAALRAAAARSTQGLRSSYMAFLALPRVPELVMTAREGAVLRRVLARSGLSEERAGHYARRMQEPGAATAALGWYRALVRARAWGPGRVGVPTTLLVGRRDPFFSRAAVARTADLVTGPYRLVELDAGHWLPEAEPAAVVAVVRELARRHRRLGGARS